MIEDENGGSLTILWSAPRAFAMTLSAQDEFGTVAVDPRGDSTAIASFVLDNGQVDTWPERSTVAIEDIVSIVDHWLRGESTTTVTWSADPPSC